MSLHGVLRANRGPQHLNTLVHKGSAGTTDPDISPKGQNPLRLDAGLLYLGLRNSGFPRTRSIYSCTASFVGFESKKKLSEEAFQAFIKEGQCRHTHTHGDYLWGLGFLPRNLPNY